MRHLHVADSEDAVIAQAIEIIKNGFDDVEYFLAREELRHHLKDHDKYGRCTHSKPGEPCPAWVVAHLVVVAFPEMAEVAS